MQKFMAIGNLGRDPETRYTQGGSPVTSFSIATSERWKDKQTGEQKERTEWHNCVAFGRLAEIVAQYVRKGSKVYIEGKLQTDSYEKDGIKRYSTKVNVRELQMLDGKGGQQEQQGAPDLPAGDDFDDDIPFMWALAALPGMSFALEMAGAVHAIS